MKGSPEFANAPKERMKLPFHLQQRSYEERHRLLEEERKQDVLRTGQQKQSS